MDTKITLTFYDIVSHLIPGAAFLLSIQYFNRRGSDLPVGEAIIYLFIFGYLIGLLLHLMGLLLFKRFFIEDFPEKNSARIIVKVFDSFISKFPLLKVKDVNPEIKKELIKAFEKKLDLNIEENRLGLFSLADTYVASLPLADRDILLAKEGVFRSLAVLIIVETLYLSFFVFPENRLVIIIAGTVLLELCRYGREHYRTIKNQQIYTLSLIKLKND